MKVMVTGSKGQLGSELQEALKARHETDEFIFVDQEHLDFSDLKLLKEKLEDIAPAQIINCAAYTAVDKAEQESELAMRINAEAVSVIVDFCMQKGSSLIQVSTDFVFDGAASRPYLESDKRNPLSVYGKSKAAAEEAIEVSGLQSAIVRTSWLYSSYGHNFLKTMLRLFQEREELGVVTDQVGTPTYAADLANFVLNFRHELVSGSGTQTFHFTNSGVASWYDFAGQIARFAESKVRIKPISTEDYPTPATRPPNSLLSKSKILKDFDSCPTHWIDSLEICMGKLRKGSR